MKGETKAYITSQGGKLLSDLIRLRMARPSKTPTASPESEKEGTSEEVLTSTITQVTQEPEVIVKQEPVATACVPCALGHFSCSAGLLNEAVRFKGEGIASNEIIDRIAKVLEEQNALERVDLTPEKIRSTPDWERDIAEEALQQSRTLRHRLETIETFGDLEQAAADTEGYYRRLNREWWKRRFAKMGNKAEPEMSLEDAKQLAAKEAAKEVEKQWQSPERGNPFWHPRFRQVGPTKESPPEAWAIWERSLREAKVKYPIGHPELMAEAERAGLTQEQTQELIAQDSYLPELDKLQEMWRKEYERHGPPEEEIEEEEAAKEVEMPNGPKDGRGGGKGMPGGGRGSANTGGCSKGGPGGGQGGGQGKGQGRK